MKIGIFTGYFLPHLGGVERYVDKMSLALEKKGYEVIIVTSNHDDTASNTSLNGRTIYKLPILNIAKNRYPIPKVNTEYRKVIDAVKAEKIDYFIVNTRFHLTSLIGARLGKSQQKPVFLIEHGTDHFTVNNQILDFFGKIYEHLLSMIIRRYVDRFYGVSKKCNEWLRHFSIRANGVFYNAINSKDALGVKDTYADKYENQLVITYAGRLIKEKGVLNLLNAFLKASEQNPRLKLIIAGDGELMQEIQHDYVHPNIDLVGRLDFNDVMALYKRTDIFIYPSLYPEGLPTSILEAGLMGCGIIATPRGGTEEVIKDDHHGIIVDGSKQAIADAILLFASNEKYRLQCASTVRSRIEELFDWDAVAKVVDSEICNYSRSKND